MVKEEARMAKKKACGMRGGKGGKRGATDGVTGGIGDERKQATAMRK